MARDGTPFICANAHLEDGSEADKTQNIRTKIPKPREEEFKKNVIRNMLSQLSNMPPPAASQGAAEVVEDAFEAPAPSSRAYLTNATDTENRSDIMQHADFDGVAEPHARAYSSPAASHHDSG